MRAARRARSARGGVPSGRSRTPARTTSRSSVNRRQLHLDRHLRSVFLASEHFTARRRSPGGWGRAVKSRRKAASSPRATSGTRSVDRLANQLAAGVAEQSFGFTIHEGDTAVAVDDDHADGQPLNGGARRSRGVGGGEERLDRHFSRRCGRVHDPSSPVAASGGIAKRAGNGGASRVSVARAAPRQLRSEIRT